MDKEKCDICRHGDGTFKFVVMLSLFLLFTAILFMGAGLADVIQQIEKINQEISLYVKK